MAEADALDTALDSLEASVAHEIQQLRDAVDSSTELAELKAAVNASVSRLTTLDESLKADDAPVTPEEPPTEPTP